MEEIAALIEKIDVNETPATNELKVITLKYSLAAEVAPVIQSAISGQTMQRTQQGQGGQGGQGGQQNFLNQFGLGQQGGQGGNQQQQQQQQARSTMLRFFSYDADGKRVQSFQSGILTDVRINYDSGSNSVVISAPTESMALIEALVRELDQPPSEKASIKVFTVKNGDASSMVATLQALFGQQVNAANQRGGIGGGFNLGGLNAGVDTGSESPLVGLSFSVDQRTNSIIVKGAEGDLGVIEAILYRLDGGDVSQRQNTTYRLKNAPAADVANSINQLLSSQRQLQQSPHRRKSVRSSNSIAK